MVKYGKQLRVKSAAEYRAIVKSDRVKWEGK
jgi:hypothetical protein